MVIEFLYRIKNENYSIIMKKLKSILFLLAMTMTIMVSAQESTVNEKLTEVNDKVNGLLERLATDEADLSKLTKIKVSGYIQAQYQNFADQTLLPASQNYFSIRRARVKFTYEALDGVKFVLQPDFAPGALSLKDAYVVVNDHWKKGMSLWMGKFNRPNYEVEYSSSQRELPERSLVIRTLYPGERAIGAKFEYNPVSTPIHFQLALFNGEEGLSLKNAAGTDLNSNENKDFDNFKDIMARVTYNLKLGSFGGLDLGAHGYFGAMKSMADSTYHSDYKTVSKEAFGKPLTRQWFGGEFQLFADVLGGMSVKGEYLAGKNATVGFKKSGSTVGAANYQNNFSGYYLYLIKNLGKKNQFAFRYDYYDPNTNITGKDVSVSGYSATGTLAKKTSSKSDLATSTFGLALHHYWDDNIRISLAYDIVNNEKAGTAGKVVDSFTTAHGVASTRDWSNHVPMNVFTLRIQAKF